MPSVLFVCTANRFRSPLASAFFRKALGESVGMGWTIDSAGTWTSPGLPVLPEVLLIARKYGLDLARHRSKPVTQALLSAHDLILVMEAGHKEALEHEFPAASSDRIHLLSQVVEGRVYDIPDLFDSIESMMEVSGNLYELIQTGVGNICSLATRLQDVRENSDQN
jgi:protein-tyrosine-phosphatase